MIIFIILFLNLSLSISLTAFIAYTRDSQSVIVFEFVVVTSYIRIVLFKEYFKDIME